MTQKRGNGRVIGALVGPVLVGALILTVTVVHVKTTLVQAPGPGGRREYRDGVYAVRLLDASDCSGFAARLTGEQAARLAVTPGLSR